MCSIYTFPKYRCRNNHRKNGNAPFARFKIHLIILEFKKIWLFSKRKKNRPSQALTDVWWAKSS